MLRSLLQGKPLRHPLHPILIHFPIGLFVLSLVLDLLSLVLDDAGIYLEGSLYVMTLGLAAAVAAAVPGIADYLSIRDDSQAHRAGRGHLILNLTVIVVYAVNVWFRWGPWDHAAAGTADRVPALGLLLSLVGVGLIGGASWIGGRMVYAYGVSVGRHRRDSPLPQKTIRVSAEGSPDGFVAVAAAEDVPEGESLRVSVDGTVVAVVRHGDRFHAVQEFCTHRFGPLSEGALYDGKVECPWHRSEFHLEDGTVAAGPAKVDLAAHEVRVVDGEVQLRLRDAVPAGSAAPDEAPEGDGGSTAE